MVRKSERASDVRPRHCFGACALALLVLLAAPADAEESVIERTLANGLRIVVQADHRRPEAVVQVWYKVGSLDETDGKTGLSHLLEHLTFRCTATAPRGEFAERIAAAGGRINAFTGHHYTAYATQVPTADVDLVLGLEADRMRDRAFSDSEFMQAMQAVKAERKWRIDDSAQARLRERLVATAFFATPAAHPVIGWSHDIDGLSVTDAEAWHWRWYGPDNAVVVVVGDVAATTVLAQAQRHFGPLPPVDPPARNLQTGAMSGRPGRIVVPADPGQPSYFAMAYPVPGLRDGRSPWEPAALRVLAALLQAFPPPPPGAAAPEYPPAVKAWYDMFRADTSLFLIDATASGMTSGADLETEIRRRIETVKRDGVAKDVLEREKTRLMRSDAERLHTSFERARRIGLVATMGLSPRVDEAIADAIDAVDSDRVQDVARRYLTDDRLTTAEVRR